MARFSRGVVALVVASLAVAGCATPGRPGTGVGSGYTPIVDMQGVDSGRYHADMAACREYANNINAGAHAAAGAIVGAVLLAAIAGSARAPSRMTRDFAIIGGASGAGGAGARAQHNQETIVKNCLAGRGYRVLDHGGLIVTQAAPAVPAAPVAPPAPAATAPAPVPAAPLAVVASTAPVAVTPTPAFVPPTTTGQDSYQVERMGREQGCNPDARAGLTGKGPGFETYSLQCSPTDVWSVRCEFGQCRVLR